MKLYQRIITGGLVVAGLVGLLGCDNKPKEQIPQVGQIAQIDREDFEYAGGNGGMGLAAADFNKDGYIDLAVIGSPSGKVILYKGNAEGTFSK